MIHISDTKSIKINILFYLSHKVEKGISEKKLDLFYIANLVTRSSSTNEVVLCASDVLCVAFYLLC
jgi:hypothetical protein